MAGFETLALAVRLPVVGRYVGELMLGIALMVGVAGVYALLSGDTGFAMRTAVMFVLVAAIAAVGRLFPAAPDLQVNESLLVVTLTFLIGSASMVWPLMSGGLAFADAVFESVSGLTTTGLTTVSDVEQQSTAFLFARAWMQWCGGLVIVVLALGLVIEPGPAARRLFGTEGQDTGMVEGTRLRARRALVIYTGLLVAGAVLLMAFGAAPLDAVVHSLSAVSTGGFSTKSNSIAGLDNGLLLFGITFLTLCGAISLSAYPRSWRHDWRRLFWNGEVLVLVIVGGLVSLQGFSWREGLQLAPLLAFSAQTTSGFEATPVADLGTGSKLILIVSMFIGGDAGSTAGGIKIVRFLLVLRLVQFVFQRTRAPRHAVLQLESAGWFDVRESYAMLALISMFIMVIVASWLVFLVLEFPPVDALFEVVSAVGTVGLTSGVTDSQLGVLPKAVLCIDMLMGRLEIIAVLLLFYPGTWIGKRA
jgi:trk system potassium uptake protein TrkH